MKKHGFPVGKDPALLFGCGRFRMEEHLLERCADEILPLGRRPLIVCDDNSHRVAFELIAGALRAEGVEPHTLLHNGFCCRDDALAYAEAGIFADADVIVGCGGGVILDFSKCIAHLADAPLVTIPTSSAQCCAYTPIAVCYTREGRYDSTSHFRREAAVSLLDTTILSRQPPRLLAAGALDAMAKKIELEFWHDIPSAEDEGQAPGLIAESVSNTIYHDLNSKIDRAMADLAGGEPTPTLRDVFFDSIVGAGIVSGIAGGSRQVALAHRFYFFVRNFFPTEAKRFTHGELVAVGLVMQLAYYGRTADAEALAARLRGWGLAASMGDMGLPFDESEAERCFRFICGTKTMKAAGSGAEPRLKEALASVFR